MGFSAQGQYSNGWGGGGPKVSAELETITIIAQMQ